MFSSYPDEWPGVGLLLLRVAIAAVLMTRAASFLTNWHELKFVATAIALLALGSAALVLTGYLARLGAFLVALASVCGVLFWSSALIIDFFQNRTTAALLGANACALICLGPGAFSLDARLFGRHEIIFPRNASEK